MEKKIKKAILAGIKKWSGLMYPDSSFYKDVTKSFIKRCELCEVFVDEECAECSSCPLHIKWGYHCDYPASIWKSFFSNYKNIPSELRSKHIKYYANHLRTDLISILKAYRKK